MSEPFVVDIFALSDKLWVSEPSLSCPVPIFLSAMELLC